METYFITSHSEMDHTSRIYFKAWEAFESKSLFIDSFDEEGKHCKSYKLENDEYTTHF